MDFVIISDHFCNLGLAGSVLLCQVATTHAHVEGRVVFVEGSFVSCNCAMMRGNRCYCARLADWLTDVEQDVRGS